MGQKLDIQKTTRSIEKVSNFIVIAPVFIVEFQTLMPSHIKYIFEAQFQL